MVVLRDEERLSPEYVPERLLFRNGELKQLLHYFSSVIYGEEAFQYKGCYIWCCWDR
jgi:Cdc6-like AAA superfamily ATPase